MLRRRHGLTTVLAAVALVMTALVVPVKAAVAQTTLNGHTVVLDGSGKIIPWTANPTDGYGQVVDLASDYFVNKAPLDPSTGKRAYFSRSYINPDTQQVVGWPHNPAGLYAMVVESALKYYAYSGNRALLNQAEELVTWHLDHGLTAASDSWPGVPYASGDAGSLTYDGADYGNATGVGDGDGVIEPDKIGELGYALLQLYEVTGSIRYRDAAIHAADVLAAKIRTGSASQSPWPFRVVAQSGVVKEQYTAHVISPIQLFDGLTRLQLGDTTSYASARQTAWTWLMTYPVQNNVWANYFEDVSIRSDLGNVNQLNALMVARYLLEHPELDSGWEQHVRGIISWVEGQFGVSAHGATTIAEQVAFAHPMGSHTSRYASVNAMLFDRTGDLAAKEKAYRAFNWATYMTRSTGVVIDGPEVNNQWFTDGYGDYIRHFLTGMGAVPAWAPAGQSHLTGSTSLVASIDYSTGGVVSYRVTDNASTESFRLAFTPTAVTAGGVTLTQHDTLATEGWTYDPATGVLRVRHDASGSVQIHNGTPTNLPPTVSITSPAAGATYTEPANLTVTAEASDTDGSVTKVEFFQGSTNIGTDTVAPYGVAWNNVGAGTYELTARATDDDGAVRTSAPVTVTVNAIETPPDQIPWVDSDVGAVGLAGSSSYANGTYTVRGSGADIWGTADAFHFAHVTRSGDVRITARVASLQNTSDWAMAGVMIRDGLAAGARHGDTSITQGHGLSFTWRPTTGGASSYTAGAAGSAPAWVRLERNGTTVTASGSYDGTTWTTIRTTTISLPDSVEVGLAVSAVNNAALNTAVFTDVTITAVPGADTTAPVISNITASAITQAGATIGWATNEPADTQVEYGTTTAYGSSTSVVTTLTTTHTQALTGLTAGRTYHYRVKSKDAAGNLAVSNDQTFTTAEPADTTAPVISGIAVSNLNSTKATISWTTDEPSDTQVVYGTAPSTYPQSTTLDTTLTTNHSQLVTGLTAEVTYYYRVRSRDAAGNLRTSEEQTFTTLPAGDTTAPDIADLTVTSITVGGATISWVTDEPADSQVEYGTTSAFGQTSPRDSALVLSHSVTLSGLSAATTYHYRVTSRDSTGNSSSSGDQTFTTATPQDTTAPSTPTGLTATAADGRVLLSWTASTDNVGVTGYLLSRNGVELGTAATSTYSDTTAAASTTYTYRVLAMDAAGNRSAYSSPVTVTTPPAQTLWKDTDIGAVGQAGSSSLVSGTYTVRGSGADIWGKADAFHFVYQPVTGNAEVTARVTSIQDTSAWAMAGVMIRNDLSPGSRHADASITYANGSSLTWRPRTGAASQYRKGPGTVPSWVRLRRQGTSFTAYTSTDGTTWTVIGSATITMNQAVYVGLAVSAVNNAALNTSTFTNVSVQQL